MAVKKTVEVSFTPEQVGKLRKLVTASSQSKWAIGDYLCELVPVSETHGVPTGATAELQWLGAQSNIPWTSLQGYRAVAHAWPADERFPSLSWAAHRVLSSARNRGYWVQKVADGELTISEAAIRSGGYFRQTGSSAAGISYANISKAARSLYRAAGDKTITDVQLRKLVFRAFDKFFSDEPQEAA